MDAWEALDCLHDYCIDPTKRELYLTSESDLAVQTYDEMEPGVQYSQVSRLIKNLRFLTTRNHKPILIHMKTCGGDLVEGFAAYDAILACPCHITILSYTHARSMSSIILQAADRRVLMPNSYFMFHRGTAEYSGDAKTVYSNVEFFRKWEDRMIYTYAAAMKPRGRYSRWGWERIRKMLRDRMDEKADVFLTAKEAVAWGLADAVFDGKWAGLKRK
jgi:ATP-dependent protease ClpP protease subunit